VTENPYAAPPTISDAEFGPAEMQIASQRRRFLNFIVDSIIARILAEAAGFGVGIAYGVWRAMIGRPVTQADLPNLWIAGFVVGTMVVVGYYLTTEGLFQRSLAKFLTGTIVVDTRGGRPTFKQTLGRSFARLIPFEPFSFFGGPNPVGWHDSLSGTRVVRRVEPTRRTAAD
jgi:uncharacterized RDD family membrane protein YckC